MFWKPLSFWAVLVLQHACATPTPPEVLPRDDDTTFEVQRMKAFAPPTELKESDNVLTLKKTGRNSPSSDDLMSLKAASGTTPIHPVQSGAAYAVDVKLGGETYELIFDSGSSDLWVARSDVQCVNARGKDVPVGRCAFGKLFPGGFEEGKVPNQNFNISYGDGEFLSGVLGYEDVSMAGVTVKHQEIALVDEGYWVGDGVTSGIIGFAYSSLTAAYTGNNPAKDNTKNSVHYPNFIHSAINKKEVKPMFSVAIERGSKGGGGQVALGGLPTVKFDHDFTSTPLEIVQFSSRHPIGAKKLTYYTITTDGVNIGGKKASNDFHAIVDTGTTLAYVAPGLARAINTAFDPPAVNVGGLWEAKCNAKTPKVSVRIGGTDFPISSSELILPKSQGYDPQTGGCLCGFQAGAEPYILGDVFLKNVVAVFDIGSAEMRFAPHENY